MHHGSARLTVYQRGLLCRRVEETGWRLTAAAEAAGVSRQTAWKWLTRYRSEGEAGLANRSTRPHRSPRQIKQQLVKKIAQARMRFRYGPHRLSWMLGIARSTIYAVLRRLGISRLGRLEPRPPVLRYEWPAPGDLLHLDTKKLGRIAPGGGKRFGGPKRSRGLGWNCVHVAVDDHSRLAYAEELPDELGTTTTEFTRRALAFYASRGISVSRILTDNGSPYRSRAFAEFLGEVGISHRRTRPYTPRTNGKAEAFVKIIQHEWAYAGAFRSTEDRIASLPRFLDHYNRERPHGGLNGARPIDRVG